MDTMFCIAIVLHLRPGCLAAYRDAHDRIWPEVAQSMNDNDVSMAIFHNDGELFASLPPLRKSTGSAVAVFQP